MQDFPLQDTSQFIGMQTLESLRAFEAVKKSGTVHPRPAKVLVIGLLKRGAWDSPQFFHSFFESWSLKSLPLSLEDSKAQKSAGRPYNYELISKSEVDAWPVFSCTAANGFLTAGAHSGYGGKKEGRYGRKGISRPVAWQATAHVFRISARKDRMANSAVDLREKSRRRRQ